MDSAEELTQDEILEDSRRNVIVGIGASAGGLQPLQEFFSLLPIDTGCSFVVIQHLSPDFESVMDTLLSRCTKMPIQVIEDGMHLECNHVYLNPPRMNAEIIGGEFSLSLFDPDSLRLPINVLFQSIANEYGSNAVAIVLSGTGSDGTKGIQAVHDAYGLTLVQSVESAEFDGMPRNAISTGVVNYVVNPAAMVQLVCEHAASPLDTDRSLSAAGHMEDVDEMNEVQVIFSLLAKEHGIDFSHYKPGTVARRIERRLQLSRFGGLERYTEELKRNPEELLRLYHDLLIGVTSFFRDPDSFRSLRVELTPAVEAATAESPLRMWCAGCASGEEAYSLAMMVYEMFLAIDATPHFKVFATDVHDRTLEVAARGIYPNESLDVLTPKQRELFFTKYTEGEFRALPRLRNHLVFAKQNIVSDPPFTKMNLVICRNLLIYLQDDAQAAAISGFRFAMKDDGLLMLGPSETLGRLAKRFEVIDKNWRLFRKNHHANESTSSSDLFKSRSIINAPSRTFKMVEAVAQNNPMPGISHRLLVEFLPSALLLDAHHNIMEVFGTVSDYLQVPSQKVRGNLLDFFDASTCSTLAAILAQAQAEEGAECSARGVRLATETRTCSADIFAKTLRVASVPAPVCLLRFQPPTLDDSDKEVEVEFSDANPHLKRELEKVRISLGSSIQDLEYTNQELQSANEEMIASNEELQATNEELQSVNEELHTVNSEHQRKVEELEEMTDDFNNLFDSSDVGLILLDKDLNIRKFTSSARRYFKLMQHDIGRNLTNFASQISVDDFFDRVREVMRSGQKFKTKARDREERIISVDISPYRANNEINGAVINIFEVLVLETETEAETDG